MDQYSKLLSVSYCAKKQYIMSCRDWELTVHVFNKMDHRAHSKTDRQTDRWTDKHYEEWLQDIWSWMTLGVPAHYLASNIS